MSTLHKQALNDAVNNTKWDRHSDESLREFVDRVSKKFIENKIHSFPLICAETRKANYKHKKFLNDVGNPGGWSEQKDFKFDYIIPDDLYLFMTNMVYRNFWGDDNRKVWRPFMEAIVKGADPESLLMAVKVNYGSSKEMIKAGEL